MESVTVNWSDDDVLSGDDVLSEDDNDLSDFEFATQATSSDPSWVTSQPVKFPDLSHDRTTDEKDVSKASRIYGRYPVLSPSSEIFDGPRFRLLQIQPGMRSAPLYAKLLVRCVFDPPIYKALSYAWGTNDSEGQIFMGDEQHAFTVSLHVLNALRWLRHEQEVVNVWVDAICINQTHLLDKAAQIPIMAQIYNNAIEVIVWLDAIDADDPTGLSDVQLCDILCSMRFQWWRRLWVVQECAYARNCPIIMFGDYKISLTDLMRRVDCAADRSATADATSEQSERFKELRDLLRCPFDAWRQGASNSHRIPLLERLEQTARREYTEPHDRIYAVLSLINEDLAHKITPDYSKSYDDLRRDVERLLSASAGGRPYDARALDDYSSRTGWPKRNRQLLDASCKGEVRRLKRLLEEGADVDAKGRPDDSDSPLYLASKEGHEEVVELLLKNGADVNAEGHFYGYALQAASHRGHSGVVGLLLDMGANVNAKGGEYGSAFVAACSGLHLGAVRLLLLQKDVNVDAGCSSDILYHASKAGDSKVVSLLLERGAIGNAKKSTLDNSLLAASRGDHWHIVKLLLEAGGITKANGGTLDDVLLAALYRGLLEIVKLLLEERKDLNAVGRYWNDTALRIASCYGHLEIVKLLLEKGADVNEDRGIGTALCGASLRGHLEVVKLLLENGAKVTAEALTAARSSGNSKVKRKVKRMLLKADALSKFRRACRLLVHPA